MKVTDKSVEMPNSTETCEVFFVAVRCIYNTSKFYMTLFIVNRCGPKRCKIPSNFVEWSVRRNTQTNMSCFSEGNCFLYVVLVYVNHFCAQFLARTEESSCPLVCDNHFPTTRSTLALVPSLFTTGLSTTHDVSSP